ncbi:ribitol-5-phosphate transferase FKTN isoform X2 [Eucyclogobius newberryi]|uniref:ribitol-5-phosphate transferase FKTN isoform X2 n=1 Tax=Eucyclogobius newberryi TaxID=166745 RepID=UPI003B5A2D0E
MVRVNRSGLLYVLALGSCAFLLFQLHYYRKYVTKAGPRLLNADNQWTVRSFLSGAHTCHVPVFLIDVSVLNSISHNAPGHHNCNFLCSRPITAFGLNAKLWSHDASSCFLAALEQKDFSWTLSSGEDPRLVGLDVSGDQVPLHLLLRRHGNVIQLVFFVERGGGFLWHGALRLRPDQDRTFPFRLLDYGRHQGAYDRPELVLTVLDGLDVRVPRNVTHFLLEQRHAHFLECGYRDAHSFLQLYPQDSSSAALDFRRKVQTLLQISVRTLGQIQVPFWISSGTCLGWLRQCEVISYSRDVDIGIFVQDFRPEIVQVLTRAGLQLKHRFGKVEDSLELSFLLDDVKLDVFFFYDDGQFMWNGGTQARTGRKFKYVFPRFSLCWTMFLELKVRVPCETLDYVRANYGDGWSVPTVTWDWKTSPSNVLNNGVWPVDQWEELIQVF